MEPTLTITLNVAEILALAAVVWGLAKMSKSVDTLVGVTNTLTEGLKEIGKLMGDMEARLRVLEDRWFRWAKP